MKNLRSFLFVFRNTTSTYADEGGSWCERGDSSDRDGDNGNSELHFDLFVVVKKDEEGDCETHLSFLSPKSSRFTMPTSGNALMVTSVFSTQYPPTEEQLMSTSL
jgi:hypothetical protein